MKSLLAFWIGGAAAVTSVNAYDGSGDLGLPSVELVIAGERTWPPDEGSGDLALSGLEIAASAFNIVPDVCPTPLTADVETGPLGADIDVLVLTADRDC